MKHIHLVILEHDLWPPELQEFHVTTYLQIRYRQGVAINPVLQGLQSDLVGLVGFLSDQANTCFYLELSVL